MNGVLSVVLLGLVPGVTLDEVLSSVDEHAPALESALADVERAEGMQRAARAPFDLAVKGTLGATLFGAYGEREAGVEVSQMFPVLGVTTYTGYRFGDDFAPYEGKRTTSEFGEVRAGVRVPLLRGALVDAARTARTTAAYDVDGARHSVERMRLSLRGRAASAWVVFAAARARRQIAADILAVAEERQGGIEAQVRAGAVAELEAIDNERLILSRKERLIAADRDLVAAAVALSFFLRDVDGKMLVATLKDAPVLPNPEMSDLDIGVLVDAAHARRPELRLTMARIDAERARLELADNDMLPNVTIDVSAAQDMGDTRAIGTLTTTKNATEVGVGLAVQLPVQQSAARGRSRSHRAALRALDAELQIVREQIELEVRDAQNALVLSQQQVDLAHQAARLAERLEEAERRRLELGQSNLLVVNLREQQAVIARESLVAAETAALLARVRLDGATGRLLEGPPRFVGEAPDASAKVGGEG
jgi:cobalt-zinc-cadmium efflux system outer membrane protein